jgi:hypothetical protein
MIVACWTGVVDACHQASHPIWVVPAIPAEDIIVGQVLIAKAADPGVVPIVGIE